MAATTLPAHEPSSRPWLLTSPSGFSEYFLPVVRSVSTSASMSTSTCGRASVTAGAGVHGAARLQQLQAVSTEHGAAACCHVWQDACKAARQPSQPRDLRQQPPTSRPVSSSSQSRTSVSTGYSSPLGQRQGGVGTGHRMGFRHHRGFLSQRQQHSNTVAAGQARLRTKGVQGTVPHCSSTPLRPHVDTQLRKKMRA